MRILSGNNIDRTGWSMLVRTSTTGTWFQTPEAYEFYASMPELFRPFVVGAYTQPLPEGRREQPTPNPFLKGGELSAHNPSHMSGLARESNSLSFTGEEPCSIERPVDARRTSQGDRLLLRAVCVSYVTKEKSAVWRTGFQGRVRRPDGGAREVPICMQARAI